MQSTNGESGGGSGWCGRHELGMDSKKKTKEDQKDSYSPTRMWLKRLTKRQHENGETTQKLCECVNEVRHKRL